MKTVESAPDKQLLSRRGNRAVQGRGYSRPATGELFDQGPAFGHPTLVGQGVLGPEIDRLDGFGDLRPAVSRLDREQHRLPGVAVQQHIDGHVGFDQRAVDGGDDGPRDQRAGRAIRRPFFTGRT